MKISILSILKDWKTESGVNEVIPIDIYPKVGTRMTICVDDPRAFIGSRARLFNKYRGMIKSNYPSIECIVFINTTNWRTKVLKI